MKKLNLMWSALFLVSALNAMKQSASQLLQQQRDTKPNVVFIDMQTTHLDPNKGEILDIAFLNVGSAQMFPQMEYYQVIEHDQTVLNSIDPFLMPRIEKAGLPYRISNKKGAIPQQQVIHKLLEYLRADQEAGQHLPILAGGSDIKLYATFLRAKMPGVFAKFSLKEPINVPSLRTVIKTLNPDDEYKNNLCSHPYSCTCIETSQSRVHALFEEYKYYQKRYFNTDQALADHSLFMAQVMGHVLEMQ